MADRIGYGGGRTINTGNYESVRLDLWRETEVELDEKPAEAHARVKLWVEARLDKEEAEVRTKKNRR